MKIVVLPSELTSIDWTGHQLAVGLHSGEVRVLESQFRCSALDEEWLV
jgi:hypothetical protein